MFCPQCGTPANDAAFCPSCGASMTGKPVMSQSASSSTGTVDPGTGLVLSGWWRRVGATLVDGLIYFVGIVLISKIWFSGSSLGHDFFINGLATVIAIIGLLFFYLYISYSKFGGTIGNKAVGTRVVGTDGGLLSSRQSALRAAVIAIPYVLSTLSVTYQLMNGLFPLLTHRKQSIVDCAASTLTVRS